MIEALEGTLERRDRDGLVLRVGPVSVRALAPSSTLSQAGEVGQPVRLYTHLHAREGEVAIFAFLEEQEREMFRHLLTVSGVGPRLALAILSAMSADDLASAVRSGDVDTLGHIPGVGRRTASRLALELRGRLAQEWRVPVEGGTVEADGETVAALVALGYSGPEARRAVSAAGGSGSDEPLEERVRRALRSLGG